MHNKLSQPAASFAGRFSKIIARLAVVTASSEVLLATPLKLETCDE
jgi:hypothetical protein